MALSYIYIYILSQSQFYLLARTGWSDVGRHKGPTRTAVSPSETSPLNGFPIYVCVLVKTGGPETATL